MNYSKKKLILPFLDKYRELFKKNNIFIRETEKIIVCEGAKIEPNTKILSGNIISTIGAFSYSNSPLNWGVSMGRYCSIARNLEIFGADHFTDWISTSPHFYSSEYQDSFNSKELSDSVRRSRRINIGHDVWIGENVKLKRDINIGTGAIIAAGAIVTKDVQPFTIVGGIPAKIIKKRFSDEIIDRIMNLQWWRYHINDLKHSCVNNPEKFLNILEKKIERQEIKEYNPEYIDFSLESLQNISLMLKQSNLESSELIFSDVVRKNYYQIHILGISRKIHFEVLLSKGIMSLCFDIENPRYCNEKIRNILLSSFNKDEINFTFKPEKFTVSLPINSENAQIRLNFLRERVKAVLSFIKKSLQ